MRRAQQYADTVIWKQSTDLRTSREQDVLNSTSMYLDAKKRCQAETGDPSRKAEIRLARQVDWLHSPNRQLKQSIGPTKLPSFGSSSSEPPRGPSLFRLFGWLPAELSHDQHRGDLELNILKGSLILSPLFVLSSTASQPSSPWPGNKTKLPQRRRLRRASSTTSLAARKSPKTKPLTPSRSCPDHAPLTSLTTIKQHRRLWHHLWPPHSRPRLQPFLQRHLGLPRALAPPPQVSRPRPAQARNRLA